MRIRCLEAIAFEWLGAHSAGRTDSDAEGTGEKLEPRPPGERLGDGPAPKPRSEEPPISEREVRRLVKAYFQHLSIDLALESAKRFGAEHFRKPVADGTAYALLGLHFLSTERVQHVGA